MCKLPQSPSPPSWSETRSGGVSKQRLRRRSASKSSSSLQPLRQLPVVLTLPPQPLKLAAQDQQGLGLALKLLSQDPIRQNAGCTQNTHYEVTWKIVLPVLRHLRLEHSAVHHERVLLLLLMLLLLLLHAAATVGRRRGRAAAVVAVPPEVEEVSFLACRHHHGRTPW